MASVDLGGELTCSICLSIYTDPVSLSCGHNFCYRCIEDTFDTVLKISEECKCPECRRPFRQKPKLTRNLKLCNIVECFNSKQNPSTTESHFPTGPTTLLEGKQCAIHDKPLIYYCSEDNSFVCTLCRSFGTYKGHCIEKIDEAYRRTKLKLQDVLEKLTLKKEDMDKTLGELEKHRGDIENKATSLKQRMTDLFNDIKDHLNLIKIRVMAEISSQESQVTARVSEHIKELKEHKQEIFKEICCMETIHKMTDPISFLMEWNAIYGSWEGDSRDGGNVRVGDNLDYDLITVTLQNGLLKLHNILGDLKAKRDFHVDDCSIILDENTAANNLVLSSDRKAAIYSNKRQPRHENPGRFQYYQALSTKCFRSGQHYWEVDVSDIGDWRVGVAYPSIERRGIESFLRYNNKSWCLNWSSGHLTSWNNYQLKSVSRDSPVCTIGIYLDYEAGLLSFYRLTEQVELLCSIKATFTEPLHAAFYVTDGQIRIRK